MDIVRLIDTFVSEICCTYEIEKQEVNTDGTITLFSCDTHYIQPCFYVTIDGQEFEVVEVKVNEHIKVKADLIEVSSFEVYKPFYIHGTIPKTSAEISQIQFGSDKYPLIYLQEVVKQKIYNIEDSDSILEREATCRLFFLTPDDYDNNKTIDSYNEIILPMQGLVSKFINVLNNSEKIATFATYDIINRVQDTRFNEYLSGIELIINIPIKRIFNCKKNRL